MEAMGTIDEITKAIYYWAFKGKLELMKDIVYSTDPYFTNIAAILKRYWMHNG